MKKLIFLFFLGLTIHSYSQVIGITSAPHKIGAGIFYNSKENNNNFAIFEEFDIGKYSKVNEEDYTNENYILIKLSSGITYVLQQDEISKIKAIGNICYNNTTPYNVNIREFSLELGIILIYKKFSFLYIFDLPNKDSKIGIGLKFK